MLLYNCCEAVFAKAVVSKAVVARPGLAIKQVEIIKLLNKNVSIFILGSTLHETLFYELIGIYRHHTINII